MALMTSLMFLGFFFIPALFYIWLAKTGRYLGLAAMGAVLIFLALFTAAGGSISFAGLYALVGALSIHRSLLQQPGEDYGLRRSSWGQAAAGACAGLLLAAAYLGLSRGTAGFTASTMTASMALLPMQGMVSFVPALWEEIYFRGIVQTELRSKIKREIPAIVLTAVLFALFHTDKVLQAASNSTANGYWYAAFLLLGGSAMGRLKERSGLLPAVLCHGCYNMIV